MAQTLDQFSQEIKERLAEFEAVYRKKADENPEHYPLSLDDNNAGLWFEFFSGYLESSVL